MYSTTIEGYASTYYPELYFISTSYYLVFFPNSGLGEDRIIVHKYTFAYIPIYFYDIYIKIFN